MTKEAMPDVVVLLPGITGSVLQRDGKDVWAFSPGAILRGLLSLGHSIKSLELVDDDWKRDDLADGVTADRVMPDLHLVPGLWKIDGYGEVTRFLCETFALTEGANFFPFAYDWRRDNRASARLLQRRSHEWLKAWRESSGNADAKLILVAHSMGGLVARYFVEALGGWKNTRAVVTFGTPFYGSVNAIDFLQHGMRKGIGPISVDLSPMIQSLTSVHQLVPVYRCVVDSAGMQLPPSDAGLPEWNPAWTAHLREFQSEMEEAAAANRQDPEWEKSPTIFRPIIGTDQRTKQSARVTDGKVNLLFELDGTDEGGDGTVPGISAALDGTQDAAMFTPQQHARIQNLGSVLGHLKGVLKSLHGKVIGDVRRAVTSWFSFQGEDLYAPGEPIRLQLSAMSDLDESQLDQVNAAITVSSRDPDAIVVRRDVKVGRRPGWVELPPLSPGTFTIDVSAENAAPVSDVFAVVGEDAPHD